MAKKVVTIEIGNERIKVCEVSKTSAKAVTVHKAVTTRTPSGCFDDGVILEMEILVKAVRMCLDKGEIHNKDVIFILTSARIANKEIAIPYIKEQKIRSVLDANATEYFPVNVDKYIIAYSILERGSQKAQQKHRLLALAAPSELVQGYYTLAELLNLKVKALDYVGNSVLQLNKIQTDQGVRVLVQIGADSTMVSVLEGDAMQLQRNIPYGMSAAVTTLMEERGLDEEAALKALKTETILQTRLGDDEVTESLRYLISNINRVVDYFVSRNQDKPISVAYVIGDGAALRGIEQLLTNEMNTTVRQMGHLDGVTVSPECTLPNEDLPGFMGNIGAVLSPVNFLPKELILKEKKSAQMQNYRIILLSCVLAAVVIVVVPALRFFVEDSRKNDFQNKINRIQDIDRVVSEYNEASKKLGDMQGFYDTTMTTNSALAEFIQDVETIMPKDVVFTTLSSTDGTLSMSGTANSKESVAALIAALRKLPNIQEISIPSINESLSAEGVASEEFSLTCTLTGEKADDGSSDTTTSTPDASAPDGEGE